MLIRIRASKPASAPHLTIEPAPVTVRSRPLRILDFDVEARPLSWIGGDYVSKEITAIAWQFVGEPNPDCRLLGETDAPSMLRAFLEAYDKADMVTGHFILGYDLPMVNGALFEHGFPPLGDKLAHDTKIHLVKAAGLSRSQESLGAMLQLDHVKEQMNQSLWRAANRLTPEGLLHVRRRVLGDVTQHIEMRQTLLDRGWLMPAKVWKSITEKPEPAYAP
jgi:hypothetical protein